MSIARIRCAACCSVIAIGLAGCTTQLEPPDLNAIYDVEAQNHGPDRNPVIVIPGILGSSLADAETGQVVWGAFSRAAANPNTPEGARAVALPMERGKSLAQLQDDVIAAGALDRVTLSALPGLEIGVRAYADILATLGAGGYRDQTIGEAGAIDYGKEHFTCFQFDYDWRRTSVENAKRLGEFIQEKKAYVEREYRKRYGSTKPVKFDIVAHSMGGLVARYFLRYGEQSLPRNGLPRLTWAGAKDIDTVILVATPNAGSLKAIDQLVNGFQIAPVLVPKYEAAVLGTMPGIYELLPRARHRVLRAAGGEFLDPLDYNLWVDQGWGLADPDADPVLEKLLPDLPPEERRLVARDHLEKTLDHVSRFQEALDRPARLPSGLELILYSGDAIGTGVVAEVTRDGVREVEWAPGDGTVARYSTLLDENFADRPSPGPLDSPIGWTETRFLFENHLGLTKSPEFSDNVLFRLLEQ